ncbi:hypothetical protein DFS34DRAFT_613769, partial [Phlyctochytrium arcticum]
MAVTSHSSAATKSRRPARKENRPESVPGHVCGPVVVQPAVQRAPTVFSHSKEAGNAAELDYAIAKVQVEELQATWDLIESGAYNDAASVRSDAAKSAQSTHRDSSDDDDDDQVEVELNGVRVDLPKGFPLSLEILGVGPNNFLFADSHIIKLQNDGTPRTSLHARAGLKLRTIPYPSMKPVSHVYRYCMNTLPSRATIATIMQTPWGKTLLNSMNSLLLAAMARPGINAASPPVQVIIAVVTGARMLDVMINDTILRQLAAASLSLSQAIFALLICQLCLMIGASIPFQCLRLLEYHIVPLLFLMCIAIGPFMHHTWLITGHLTQSKDLAQKILGHASWIAPIVLFAATFGLDIALRLNQKVDNLLTCEAV